MEIKLKPIGIIHSPFTKLDDMPIQPCSETSAPGKIEVWQEYSEGLQDLEGFSHIVLLYHFHKTKNYSLKVKPFLDKEKRGVFATRAPSRPNSIGMSVVKLAKIENNILFAENLDILDGTPLLDIKPYVPDFDHHTDIKIGWLESVIEKKNTKSDDRFIG